MGIIWAILIGLVVGVLAKFLHPGKEDLGLVMTALLGIAGSMVASFGGQALGIYHPGQGAGFIGALIGAVLILFVYTRIKR
ncbi:MAG TPA: GlsB/YeaQ/YmgE family stress response membrane protein [Denitromonas sp.]|uniref:GlsB/YeaQ/YmgE family stress response membrane protein n=1 Tax=Denitromonas sp. TaxID=2734609 RepID=UPI001D88A691|nr:GlsB/YeaQ/YmgE family stress response membrane protein [Rhodocyclaceae bacterium]MCP5220085.1 GlsB/YeaQ/YmgE family stress response membrane protein [Zoogloeaceae bacterium]HPR05064.1 GlsB/YeaQ/YmgE family stress response membrane protein [Denitromonas sp.]HQU86955.1 GlsB/YeaQ/YmgE family stress response membrane protein [Denitromonas sp.]HQV13293.1 GlsB/YeaQ/YmgE family stress response membrane protein [Denitromonas sp.]